MEEELIFRCADLLNEVYKKINYGIPLSDYENGVYQTLRWIIESECDEDCKPEIHIGDNTFKPEIIKSDKDKLSNIINKLGNIKRFEPIADCHGSVSLEQNEEGRVIEYNDLELILNNYKK